MFQLGDFESMIEHVIASIHQFILGKVVCTEAPSPDLFHYVLFTVMFYVEIAGKGSAHPLVVTKNFQIIPMLIILNYRLGFADAFQQFLDPNSTLAATSGQGPKGI